MFDDHIQMDAHISHICRTTHFHLRKIGAIRNLLTDSATVWVEFVLLYDTR